MPTARNTSSKGAPKRSAIRLDRMPASTSRLPSRIAKLIVSSAPIVTRAITAICAKRERRLLDDQLHLSSRRERIGGGQAVQHAEGFECAFAERHAPGELLL